MIGMYKWREMIGADAMEPIEERARIGIWAAWLRDRTRGLYNALLNEFAELTHDASLLWDEVKQLRARVLRAEGFNRTLQEAVDLRDKKLVAAENLSEQRRQECHRQLRLKNDAGAEGERLQLAYNAAMEKVKCLELELSEIKMVKAQLSGIKGVELTMDVCGNEVRGRVYELECYGDTRRKGVLAERKVVMPTPKAPHIGLRLMCHVPPRAPTVEAFTPCGAVVATMTVPRLAPLTYGVDFGKTAGDSTVVTVRQGDKVLHAIDMTAERQKWKAKNLAEHYGGLWAVSGSRYTWSGAGVQFQNFPREKVFLEPKHVRMVFPRLKPNGVVLDEASRVPPSMFSTPEASRYDGRHDETVRMGQARIAEDLRKRDATRARLEKWQANRKYSLKRHGKWWRPEEDQRLFDGYRTGTPLWRLSMFLEREWEAVLYRLARNAKWPESWISHDKFLNFALMWFFTTKGEGFGEPAMRLRRYTELPRGGLFQ